MTDEQIIKGLQTVLDKIHTPDTGIFQNLCPTDKIQQTNILNKKPLSKNNGSSIRLYGKTKRTHPCAHKQPADA